MKVGNVVIKKLFEEAVGETRKVTRSFVRVAPLTVTSVATEAAFIPLADEIPLTTQDTITNVLPGQPEMDYFKDAKPTNFESVDLAKLKSFQRIEFIQRKFSVVAVVELPSGTIFSRDSFVQSVAYGPQVALIPVWGETELPTGAKLAGLVEYEGYAISAQDGETGQVYFLGYRFAAEDRVNWTNMAFERRRHWKRSEKNDGSEEVKAPTYSSIYFASDDPQVIARVAQKYGRGKELPNGKTSFNLPSFDAFEKCQEIEREVVRLRQKAIIERDFDALETLR